MREFSLILPVHNEEKIIKPVFLDIIKTLNKLDVLYECILVENGSKDNSLKIIRQLAKKYKNVQTLITPQGYGSAVLAGLNKAKGEYLCYMPSDGQVDLTVFPELWQVARRQKYDLVKVRRISRETKVRLFISYIFSLIIKLLFSTPFLDINGSPRIFRREKLKALNLQSQDSFIDAEFTIKAKRLNWSIKEIPTKTLPRLGGKSTRKWRTFLEFFKNILYYKLFGFKA